MTTTETPRTGSSQTTPRRVNCVLIPRAAVALDTCMAREQLTATDAVNRALQLYGAVQDFLATGATMAVVRDFNTEHETVQLWHITH